MKVNFFIGCFFVVVIFSCRDPYLPPVVSSSVTYMVVEGNLNAGAGATSIRITRSGKLDGSINIEPEQNAQVTVDGADNSVRPLASSPNGYYTSAGLNLTIGTEYRVRIKTNNGREYLSEYVKAVQTPPIDSIGWTRDDDGAICYVNTHDPAGKTTYYRWEYDDTWQIVTYYGAKYIYLGGTAVRLRTADEQVSVCWKYGTSTRIILGSSERLQSDVIHEAPLIFYANGDEKLAVRYSVLLRQYALDKKGYEFYELVRKNTESIGSIFDPQPSEITGNITCLTDPKERVIGYVTASTVSEKRAFVTSGQLGGWMFEEVCPAIPVIHPDSTEYYFAGGYGVPIDAVISGNDTTHFISTPASCGDCTFRGGSLVRPSYW